MVTRARAAATSSNFVGLRMTATRFLGGRGVSSSCAGRKDDRVGRFGDAWRPLDRLTPIARATPIPMINKRARIARITGQESFTSGTVPQGQSPAGPISHPPSLWT